MYEKQDIQLIKQISNEHTKKKRRGITMFTIQLCFCLLLLLTKGTQVTLRRLCPTIAKIHSQLDQVANKLDFSQTSRTHEMIFNELAGQIFCFTQRFLSLIFKFLIYLGGYIIIMLIIQCSSSLVRSKNFVATNPSANQLVNFKPLFLI